VAFEIFLIAPEILPGILPQLAAITAIMSMVCRSFYWIHLRCIARQAVVNPAHSPNLHRNISENTLIFINTSIINLNRLYNRSVTIKLKPKGKNEMTIRKNRILFNPVNAGFADTLLLIFATSLFGSAEDEKDDIPALAIRATALIGCDVENARGGTSGWGIYSYPIERSKER
jgi:hypothetical protein